MSLLCWIFGHHWIKQPTISAYRLYRCARCYEITDEPDRQPRMAQTKREIADAAIDEIVGTRVK